MSHANNTENAAENFLAAVGCACHRTDCYCDVHGTYTPRDVPLDVLRIIADNATPRRDGRVVRKALPN